MFIIYSMYNVWYDFQMVLLNCLCLFLVITISVLNTLTNGRPQPQSQEVTSDHERQERAAHNIGLFVRKHRKNLRNRKGRAIPDSLSKRFVNVAGSYAGGSFGGDDESPWGDDTYNYYSDNKEDKNKYKWNGDSYAYEDEDDDYYGFDDFLRARQKEFEQHTT